MKIKVIRYNKTADHTEGIMLLDGKFQCYTLEDEEREVKVKHETCIPEGEYEVTLRKVGGFHERYSKKFAGLHDGMLWIRNVPNFEYILIHIGNYESNTSGCILVGNKADATKDMIGSSTDAYKAMYKKVLAAFNRGEKVTIEIVSI